MKKYILATLLIASSSFVLADGFTGATAPNNAGGYTGPANTSAKLMTVKQAQSLSDDSYVTLRGNIVQHIREDKYSFQDSTGKVVVEIDNDLWYGLTVAPTDTVEIIGEVDKDSPWGNVEIDVKRIKKI